MVDVVVIGAGPSGLFVASELIRHGLSCRIIDKASHPSDKSKALAIQARSLEVLDQIGLADTCIQQGLKIRSFVPFSNHRKLVTISFDHLESPFPFVLSLEQSKFEQILINHLAFLGCQVEREVELISFQQKDQNVELHLRHIPTNENETFVTSWLIGCDGPHSTVRDQLALSFEGISFPQILSLADVDIQWEYPRDCVMPFLDKRGLLFVVPIAERNRYRLIFQLKRGIEMLTSHRKLALGEIPSQVLQKPTLEEATQLVQQHADPNAIVTNPVWMTNFHIHSRMVNHYRVSRVFLVGDAAHIHSPVGGQGMNTGLQDGFNLAWKLAWVHKGKANSALLDSYHDERHFVGQKLLRATERATHFIMLHSPLLQSLRNFLISFIASYQFVQRRIISTIAQIRICYPPSPWIMQQSSRKLRIHAGKRAPDASIIYQGKQTSLYSLWKGKTSFQLLVIDLQNQFPDHLQRIATLQKHYEERLSLFYVQEKVSSNEGAISDFKGHLNRLYGDLTLYLIRPDGYIGYAGPLSHIDPLTRYLQHLFI